MAVLNEDVVLDTITSYSKKHPMTRQQVEDLVELLSIEMSPTGWKELKASFMSRLSVTQS